MKIQKKTFWGGGGRVGGRGQGGCERRGGGSVAEGRGSGGGSGWWGGQGGCEQNAGGRGDVGYVNQE